MLASQSISAGCAASPGKNPPSIPTHSQSEHRLLSFLLSQFVHCQNSSVTQIRTAIHAVLSSHPVGSKTIDGCRSCSLHRTPPLHRTPFPSCAPPPHRYRARPGASTSASSRMRDTLLSAPAAPFFRSRSAHPPICHLEAISPFISSPPFILGSWLQSTVLRLALTRLCLLY
jgi:hypothetical protein